MPLLIDTDIGTDPDDLQVLMMAGHLGLELCGVTTVYGDTDLRARMAAAIAPLVGIDCPIVAGRQETLSGRAVVWAGHEGNDVPGIDAAEYDRSQSAPRFITAMAGAHAGELDILAIGPLTNLAVALLADPSLASRIRTLSLMGGDFSPDARRPEHNFSCDAVATWVVLHSGIPTLISGFDMTRRVVLTDDDQRRIEHSGAAGTILAANTKDFVEWIATFGEPEFGRGHIPHDPIALLALIEPEQFTFETCRVDATGIGTDSGHVRAVPDESSTTRVVRELEPDLVHRRVVDTLVRSNG